MAHSFVSAESLVHDLHNFYGVRADVLDALAYMQQEHHPTPGGFLQWLKTRRDG